MVANASIQTTNQDFSSGHPFYVPPPSLCVFRLRWRRFTVGSHHLGNHIPPEWIKPRQSSPSWHGVKCLINGLMNHNIKALPSLPPGYSYMCMSPLLIRLLRFDIQSQSNSTQWRFLWCLLGRAFIYAWVLGLASGHVTPSSGFPRQNCASVIKNNGWTGRKSGKKWNSTVCLINRFCNNHRKS